MEHLNMRTPNTADENFAKLAALFPNAVTEVISGYDADGKAIVERAIDKDVLMQEINARVVEGREERYQFTWPDKKKCILLANAPTTATLRPCREESVDFDTTENLYIEGNNLEILKLLQETYLGKIKMIYIDPPYNTGNDFVYSDRFAVGSEQWEEMSGQFAVDSETGENVRITDNYTRNTESNGRFHTDWLNMMYPRLKLAKDLLADDGVIFISIDDNEVGSVQWLVKSIFGEQNFVTTFVWRKKSGGGQTTEHFAVEHEYILCCAKDASKFKVNYDTVSVDESDFTKIINGRRASIMKLEKWGSSPYREDRPSLYYPIKDPNGNDYFPIAPDGNPGRWRKKPETVDKNHIYWQESKGKLTPYEVTYFDEVSENKKIIMPRTILYDFVENTEATKDLANLFGANYIFDFSKPIKLIKHFIKLTTDNSPLPTLILDFFSGSATTAHAVMQLNAEDGGKRRFIMVQLPEPCDEKSEAYKAGYKNICEIGKERIRRAGKAISEQLAVSSSKLAGASGQLGGKNGKKLQGTDSLAKGDGNCDGDLFAGKETAERGALFALRPNEEGGGVDSVEHSGRAGEKFNEGIRPFSFDSERLKSGTGNSAAALPENRLPDGTGNPTDDRDAPRSRENALFDKSKTDNCPLITDNCPLITDNCPLITDHSKLDTGFRVLKCDTSNMEDVYYSPDDIKDKDWFKDNVKQDRTSEDLLFQVMLDLGIELSAKIEAKKIGAKSVYYVNAGYLVACFDSDVTEETITKIAREKPYYFVMRDSSMADDSVATNFKQIFATYSPQTVRRVI